MDVELQTVDGVSHIIDDDDFAAREAKAPETEVSLQQLITRVCLLEQHFASCLSNQETMHQVMDKCDLLERRLAAMRNEMDERLAEFARQLKSSHRSQIGYEEDEHEDDPLGSEEDEFDPLGSDLVLLDDDDNPDGQIGPDSLLCLEHLEDSDNDPENDSVCIDEIGEQVKLYLCELYSDDLKMVFDDAEGLADHYTSQHSLPPEDLMPTTLTPGPGPCQKPQPTQSKTSKKLKREQQPTKTKKIRIRHHKCDFEGCRLSFRAYRELDSHCANFHGLKSYACEECGAKYGSDKNLWDHKLRVHSGEGSQVPCPYCGRNFHKINLTKHIRAVHNKKEKDPAKEARRDFVCDECGKAFKAKTYLQTHKRIHTGERPFPCPHCEKQFRSTAALYTHVLLHTGKPYVCDECGWAFARMLYFREHKRCHKMGTVRTVDRPLRPGERKVALMKPRPLLPMRQDHAAEGEDAAAPDVN